MTNPEELSLREAIEILSAHNDWRRGLRDLKKAADLAISVLECEIRQHEAVCGRRIDERSRENSNT